VEKVRSTIRERGQEPASEPARSELAVANGTDSDAPSGDPTPRPKPSAASAGPSPTLDPAAPKVASFLSDLGSSLLTQAFVVVGNLATLRLAARAMTPDQVGELALGRRVLVFLIPLLLVGLGVGLPRTLGSLHTDRRREHATAMAGWLFGIMVALAAAGIILAYPAALARLLFGSAEQQHLVRPLIVMIIGQQAFMLTFAVFRGRLQIRRANLLQALHAGMIPVASVLLIGRSGAVDTLWTIGASTCLLAVLSAVVLFKSLQWNFSWQDYRASLHSLLSYGIPRVPGDLANAGLYALGPLLAAHALDMRAAGMLAIGLQFVTVVAAAFGPLGLVLLPRLSRTLARQGENGVRQSLPAAIGAVCYASGFMALFGAAFGNTCLTWVLSPDFRIVPVGLALLALAAGGNVVVVVLRSLNDAAYFRPVNAANAGIALGVQAGLWWILSHSSIGRTFVAICAAIAVSFFVQALLTLAALCKRFDLRAPARAWIRWVAVQGFTLIVMMASSRFLGDRRDGVALLVQALSFGTWILVLRLLGVRCFGELLIRVQSSRRRRSECGETETVPIETEEATA
jgi:O-antigen/teichoic acid export membrane protein